MRLVATKTSSFLATILVSVIVGLGAGYAAVQPQVTSSQSQVTSFQSQVASSQSQVASLQSQVTSFQSQVASSQSQVASLQSQVTSLNSQVKQAHLEVSGKADTFEAKFHDLLQEHDFLLINTVRRSLDSHASFNSSYNALLTNINSVAGQIATIYGNASANQFKALWITKINNFINYTNIVKTGDKATANATLAASMAAYEEASATFWSTLNPNIDKATFKQIVIAHVNNVKAAVDYWGAGDYVHYFAKLSDSYYQIGFMADAIVTAIVLQHPELFYP